MSDDVLALAHRAALVIGSGGVIVYPTETVYGIGCDPLNAASIERVHAVKGRPDGKPMLLLAASLDQVERFAGRLDERSRRLAERFWPGPLTMIVSPRQKLPSYLYGESGGVAFRVTPHRLAGMIASKCGLPIISTSANRSGEAPVNDFKEAVAAFRESVDLVLPVTEPMTGQSSTLIDMTGDTVAIIRGGVLPTETIMEAF